jgi:hypothetical protein
MEVYCEYSDSVKRKVKGCVYIVKTVDLVNKLVTCYTATYSIHGGGCLCVLPFQHEVRLQNLSSQVSITRYTRI